MFTRCVPIATARIGDASSFTSPKITSPAPMSASLAMNATDASAPARTPCPLGNARHPHTASATTSTVAIPAVTRCVNSITVSSAGARGTTSPLHAGQCSPHPAPEPVARTNAPHALAATLYARTDQAKVA